MKTLAYYTAYELDNVTLFYTDNDLAKLVSWLPKTTEYYEVFDGFDIIFRGYI